MTRSTASRTQITETDFFSFPDVFYVQNGPTDCRAVLLRVIFLILVIHVAPVRNRDSHNDQFFIADFHKQTVVTDAVAPVSFQISGQGFAGCSGVFAVLEMLTDPFHDDGLNGPVKLAELLFEFLC